MQFELVVNIKTSMYNIKKVLLFWMWSEAVEQTGEEIFKHISVLKSGSKIMICKVQGKGL